MNMKPPEILSLLEEASGTKLYERKKDAALKTLEKKQKKLDEIDQVCSLPFRHGDNGSSQDACHSMTLAQQFTCLEQCAACRVYAAKSRSLWHGSGSTLTSL
jgi:hypothetical protein